MGAASRAVNREASRGLLTLANVITVAAPVAADWNDSHIFNQRWPSHTRFHGVVALAMTCSLAGLNLWSLWSDATDRQTSCLFAAAVPVGYWARSLWRPWFGVPGWTTRRTRFPGSRACQPACWARRPPASLPSPVGCWIDVPVTDRQMHEEPKRCVRQRRERCAKRAFNWTSRERFPFASTVGGDLRQRPVAQRFPAVC